MLDVDDNLYEDEGTREMRGLWFCRKKSRKREDGKNEERREKYEDREERQRAVTKERKMK